MFKKTLSTLALCMCLLGANAQVADYNVVPLPQNVTAQKGKAFTLTPQTTIVYSGNDQAMKDNANFLAEYPSDNRFQTQCFYTKGKGNQHHFVDS